MSTTPTPAEIERSLDALINSRTFSKTDTLRRLLQFLVRAVISETGDDLTESAIATAVLRRDAGFDPLEDSIVRKTMARLRDKLMVYYAGEGRAAELRVVLERGSYRPSFLRKEQVRIPLNPIRAPRVLLLPFNPVNFQDDGYFTGGLQEDLMIALAAGGGIPIVPWTTAHYVREKTGDMREYHRVTGADVILDGTVRRLGESLFQVTLSWVDGLTAVFDSYLQVRTAANDTTEAVQALCEQITQRLGAGFSAEVHSQIEPRHTADPEARSLYLRARQASRLGTFEGTRVASAYLSRALDLEPDYAAAHALMADVHIYAGISGIGSPRTEMHLAIESAQKALRSAPRLATAMAAKGGVQFAFQWDFAAARKSLANARALDPTSDGTHFWSEAVVAAADDPATAAARMEEHAEADNCSASTAYLAASYCYNARQWKRTEFWSKKAIELDPAYFRPYPFLAGACVELGRLDEALTFAQTARRLSGPNPYTSGMLGIVLARSGRSSEARAVLDDHTVSAKGFSSALGEAVICSALDDRKRALDAIQRMIENREPYVAWLHIFPFFQALREEPRFRQLLDSRCD